MSGYELVFTPVPGGEFVYGGDTYDAPYTLSATTPGITDTDGTTTTVVVVVVGGDAVIPSPIELSGGKNAIVTVTPGTPAVVVGGIPEQLYLPVQDDSKGVTQEDIDKIDGGGWLCCAPYTEHTKTGLR